MAFNDDVLRYEDVSILDLMNNPVSTACNHHFCKFCIYECLDKKRFIPCPMCNVILTKRSLLENGKLKTIIEKLKNLLSAVEKDDHYMSFLDTNPGISTNKQEIKEESLPTHSTNDRKQGIKRKLYSPRNPKLLNIEKVEHSLLNSEDESRIKEIHWEGPDLLNVVSNDPQESVSPSYHLTTLDTSLSHVNHCSSLKKNSISGKPVISDKETNSSSSSKNNSNRSSNSNSSCSSNSSNRSSNSNSSCSSSNNSGRSFRKRSSRSNRRGSSSYSSGNSNNNNNDDNTSEEVETPGFSKLIGHHSKKELTPLKNSPLAEGKMLPNLSALLASTIQMKTKGKYNGSIQPFKNTSNMDLTSQMLIFDQICLEGKSVKISSDSKLISNFFLRPDFELMGHNYMLSSIMSNIAKLSRLWNIYPPIKENSFFPDFTINKEKHCIHRAFLLENCKENAEEFSENTVFRAIQDKSCIISNYEPDKDNNFSHLSIMSPPLFHNNSSVNRRELSGISEISESPVSSQQNNNKENFHDDDENSFDDVKHKIVSSSGRLPENGSEVAADLSRKPKPTPPTMCEFNSQESTNEIPCSLLAGTSPLYKLPELQNLYENETGRTEREEDSERKVLYNKEFISKDDLPVPFKSKAAVSVKSLTSTMNSKTDHSPVESHGRIPSQKLKRRCFSLEERHIFGDEVLNGEPETSGSSTNNCNSLDKSLNSKLNCNPLAAVRRSGRRRKSQRPEATLDGTSSSDRASPTKLGDGSRKRRKFNDGNASEVILNSVKHKRNSVKHSRCSGSEARGESQVKQVCSSNEADSYNDSLTQAPSCDEEMCLEPSCDTFSPQTMTLTPCIATLDTMSEPLSDGCIQPTADENNSETTRRKAVLSEDSDILLTAGDIAGIDMEHIPRSQNSGSNLDPKYLVNILPEQQESENKMSQKCKVFVETNSGISTRTTTVNEQKKILNPIKNQSLKISNNNEIESLENSQKLTEEAGEVDVNILSQLDVPRLGVDISTPENVSQVPKSAKHSAQVDGGTSNSGSQKEHIKPSSREGEGEELDTLNKDSEDSIINEKGTSKICKPLVISESEAEPSDDNEEFLKLNKENFAHSESVGSQSEKFSTQLCTNLVNDLVEMKKQIALLEAKLGMEDSIVNEDDEEDEGWKESDVTSVPQKDVTPLPQKDVKSLPQKVSTSVPQKVSTSVPLEESTPLPQEDSSPLPLEDSTPLPQKSSTSVPQEDSSPLPLEHSTSLPQEESTSVPQEVNPVLDDGDCLKKYGRLSSDEDNGKLNSDDDEDEENIIPDSHPELSPDEEKAMPLLANDDDNNNNNKTPASKSSEEIFFSASFQDGSLATGDDNVQNGSERREKRCRNRARQRVKSKHVPIITSDDSDDSTAIPEWLSEGSANNHSKDSTQSSTKNSTKDSTKNSNKVFTKDSTKVSTKDSTQNSTKNSTSVSTKNPSMVSPENSTMVSTKNSIKDSTKVSTKNPTPNSTKNSTKDSTKVFTKNPTPNSTKDSTKVSPEKSSIVSTKDSIKRSIKDSKVKKVLQANVSLKSHPDKESPKYLSSKRNKIKSHPKLWDPFECCGVGELGDKSEDRNRNVGAGNSMKQTKHLVTTGLSNVDVHQVKQFCDQVGFKFSSSFSSQVTHVIVKTVSPQVRYCDRTLKYFQGIAHKCWVLSFQWIEQSLNKQMPLKESDFEITGDTVNGKHHRGPTRSRLSNVNLLTSYQIHLTGETSELPLGVLESLVRTLGGTMVSKPEYFDVKSKTPCLVISSGEMSPHLARSLHKGKGVLVVSREWLLDSIATFERQPLESYILL